MVDDIRPDGGSENKNLPKFDSPEIPDDGPEIAGSNNILSNDLGSVAVGSGKKPEKKRLHHHITEFGMRLWPTTKKQRIIGAIIVAVLLVLGGIGAYALKKYLDQRNADDSTLSLKYTGMEPSRLTGVEIPKELNQRHVTSIMIENSPDARPQSGLIDAGVVFEAIAEGGITRFNALFLEPQPDYIGPVRSVRPYYVDLFMPFNPAIAHAGGSAEGLAKLAAIGAQDLDHGANPDAFQRVSNRYAPHNLYTSMKALDKAAKARGYKATDFTSYPRKQEQPAEKPKVTTINFALSGFLYDAQFKYKKSSNSYLRNMAGAPHKDLKSGKQLEPKVVIALEMKYSQNGIYSVYGTRGKGKMFVFQDGRVQKGIWKKNKARDQFEFLKTDGTPLKLNPGQTWITLVKAGDVSFKK